MNQKVAPRCQPDEAPERILRRLPRIERMLDDEMLEPPLTVDLEVSWLCNHRCTFCAYLDQHRQKYMPIEVFEQTVTYCRDNQVPWVLISGGGEPTLNPQFEQMLGILTAAAQPYALYTNGSRLGRLAPRLAHSCRYLRVSLDAAVPRTYARVHDVPESEFSRVVDGIREMRRLDPAMPIGLAYVIVDENQDETHAAVRLAEQLDLDTVLFRVDIRDPRKRHLEPASIPVSSELKVVWRDTPVQDAHRSRFCYGSSMKMVIDAAGDQSLCCRLREQEHVIGNVTVDGVAGLWGSPRHRAMLGRIDPSTDCSSCRFRAANNLVEDALERRETSARPALRGAQARQGSADRLGTGVDPSDLV